MIDNLQTNHLSSAFQSGIDGYQRGGTLVRDGSANLAQSNKHAVDINRAVIDITAGSIQAEASASVIKRADGMIGTIIDTFA